MRLGKQTASGTVWDEEFTVEKGDCFTVAENRVHQIANHGTTRLLAAFVCPPAHVGNDRFFVE
jgi:mannose-6-phosphate isomerase-like protein (cupin superfamily)